MKKFSRITESLDRFEYIDDCLLELIESKFIKLYKKPTIINNGDDITVEYHLLGFDDIVDLPKLESYISVLRNLYIALNRASIKFKLVADELTIYFDLPSKLVKLMDDIRQYKNDMDFGILRYRPFSIPLGENNNYLFLDMNFDIDSDFVIKIDVTGASWPNVSKLNSSEKLQEDLINMFTKKYGFKYTGNYIEPMGSMPDTIKHWYFQV